MSELTGARCHDRASSRLVRSVTVFVTAIGQYPSSSVLPSLSKPVSSYILLFLQGPVHQSNWPPIASALTVFQSVPRTANGGHVVEEVTFACILQTMNDIGQTCLFLTRIGSGVGSSHNPNRYRFGLAQLSHATASSCSASICSLHVFSRIWQWCHIAGGCTECVLDATSAVGAKTHSPSDAEFFTRSRLCRSHAVIT